MRHYLEVSFSKKDAAKKEAENNGTRIQWDAAKKKWFWEGGDLPEFLKKYTYQTTPHAYAERKRSFGQFLKSDAGARYRDRQDKILADDMFGGDVSRIQAARDAQKSELDAWADELKGKHECIECGEHYGTKPAKCACGGKKFISF